MNSRTTCARLSQMLRPAANHDTQVRRGPAPATDASGPRAGEPPSATARPYIPPLLELVATADDLLEVLGPAQANYGGTGLP
jgi:hypothetical protein